MFTSVRATEPVAVAVTAAAAAARRGIDGRRWCTEDGGTVACIDDLVDAVEPVVAGC